MILLLILLNICHWIGDYTHLSTKEMLDAKRFGKPLFPILKHAYIHAALFFFVTYSLFDMDSAIDTFLIQLVTHFLIDVLKGKLNLWFPKVQSPSNKMHWYIFGFDQLLHQLVIIWIAYLVTC